MLLESNTALIIGITVTGLVFATMAVKTRTWWWIPGGLLVAAAVLIAFDALTLPAQPYRVVVVFGELLAACVSLLLGFAVLHGVSSWRDRMARLDALDDAAEFVALPRALARAAKRRSA